MMKIRKEKKSFMILIRWRKDLLNPALIISIVTCWRKENYSGYRPENEEKIGSEELKQREKEKDSLKMDEIDDWACLGESANLPDFNPEEVFSSSDDTIGGLQLSKDEENSTNNPNDETMVENFCSHASHSSSKNVWFD